jgi:D-alanyl-D-alanine carboxypeptidase
MNILQQPNYLMAKVCLRFGGGKMRWHSQTAGFCLNCNLRIGLPLLVLEQLNWKLDYQYFKQFNMNPDMQNKIKLCVEQTLQESETPGAAIAIYTKSQSLLSIGVGYQDLKHEICLPENAIFYIYSITKILLSIGILNLVEGRKLDLDASVQIYLSDLSIERSLTVRQLLSHTSGLLDYGSIPAYFDDLKNNPNSPWSTTKLLSLIKSQSLKFMPGKGWSYSNIGYLLLKLILEKITNLPIQEYLKKIIFDRLNLQKTFFVDTLQDACQLTPGYSNFFSDRELENVIPFYHPGWVSHGVVASTAPELAKIIDSLFVGKLLNLASAEEMQDPIYIFEQKHPLFNTVGYGLGLCLGLDSLYGNAGHNGAGPGYSVAAFNFSNLFENPITFVALANRDRQDLDLGTTIIFRIIKTLEKSGMLSHS